MHIIFRTKKGGETIIAGQTGDTSLSSVSDITKKATGERPTHITGGDNWRTGHTENFDVELIDKEIVRGAFKK